MCHMYNRVFQKTTFLDFNVALLLLWFQINIETTPKKFKALALLHQVPLGASENPILRQILLYKIPKFLPIFLKVS